MSIASDCVAHDCVPAASNASQLRSASVGSNGALTHCSMWSCNLAAKAAMTRPKRKAQAAHALRVSCVSSET